MENTNKDVILSDLVTLLKFFDVDYATDDDCRILGELNPNLSEDVAKAANALLLPAFLTYKDTARDRLLKSLKMAVEDPKENFEFLFGRIGLAFDHAITNKLEFMRVILEVLESGGKKKSGG